MGNIKAGLVWKKGGKSNGKYKNSEKRFGFEWQRLLKAGTAEGQQ